MEDKSSSEGVETSSDDGSNAVKWLDLPTGLWTVIAKNLIVDGATFEIYRFRGMCSTWRDAHPHPQRTPFAPQVCIPLHHGKCLRQTKIYRLEPLSSPEPPHINIDRQDASISSSKGWIVMLGDTESVPLRLLNPFTGSPDSNNTPQISSSDTLPKVLNFMNFKVVQLIEAFYLSGRHRRKNGVEKVVLFPSFPVEGRMVCALFYGGGLCVRKIGDKKWTKIRLGQNYQCFVGFHDIIIHKGQLYVIDNLGTIFWMNPVSLQLVQFTQPLWFWYNSKTKQMVECGGRIYVVDMQIRGRHLRGKVDIQVHRVNEESGRWEVVENLGDDVLVLGKDSNFSLSAQDYHGLEGNCIYLCQFTYTFRVLCFSLKDSMLKTASPFWPCPSLFNH